jgi:WD40 repeat protein
MTRVVVAPFLFALTWSCVVALNGAALKSETAAGNSGVSVMKLTKIQAIEGVHKGSFSRDGNRLALLGQNYVEVIEVAGGRKLSRIDVPDAILLAARFSPDGQSLATAYRLRMNGGQSLIKATVWDAASGREKITLAGVDRDWRRIVDDLAFSPDGRLLASNLGGIARFWEVATGKEARRFVPETGPQDQEAERTLLSPDGKWLAVYFISPNDREYKVVRLWNVENGQQQQFECEIYLDWQFSADSRLLAMTAMVDKGKSTQRSVGEIWDVVTAKRLKIIEPAREWRGVNTVAISPDAKLLAIGAYKKFGVFSIESGELLASETHHRAGFFQDSELPSEVSDIEFSPDGTLLLTGGNDRIVKLWRFTQ